MSPNPYGFGLHSSLLLALKAAAALAAVPFSCFARLPQGPATEPVPLMRRTGRLPPGARMHVSSPKNPRRALL